MAASKAAPKIQDPKVRDVFQAYPKAVRNRLMDLRRLIFETAASTSGVGTLEETLKWGQPSYLTPETKSGSTIRIDQVKDRPGEIGMYFNCNSRLVETFVELYPGIFKTDFKRVLLFDEADALFGKRVSVRDSHDRWASESRQGKPLRHCIALALTYHLRKRHKLP